MLVQRHISNSTIIPGLISRHGSNTLASEFGFSASQHLVQVFQQKITEQQSLLCVFKQFIQRVLRA
jgi:hypothetical protein